MELLMGPVNSYRFMIQSVEVAKDTVFPSRSLKRQLEDAQTKLKEMEDELRSMKEYENDRSKRQKMEVQHPYVVSWACPLPDPRRGKGSGKCVYKFRSIPHDSWGTILTMYAYGGAGLFHIHSFTTNDNHVH